MAERAQHVEAGTAPRTDFWLTIGGERVAGDGRLDVINPATGKVFAQAPAASRAQLDAAVRAARTAFESWRATTYAERAELVRAFTKKLRERQNELAELLTREQGKPLSQSIAEIDRGAAQSDGMVTIEIPVEVLIDDADRRIELKYRPLGVVGIITPWNFPIAIPAWKIAPAIAYGNTVVFKPADLVPASAWALTEIISRSGLPAGVFNLVMGRGSVVGQAILDSPDVNAVTFTGSVSTGRMVAAACVASIPMKKVQLEMGGKNPLVVLDDADLDVAVECAVNGAFYSTGQRCTASSRLIVTEGIHDRFVSAVVDRLSSLVVGDALDPKTQIGPVVDQSQLDQDLDYIRVGQEEGAKLVFGGDLIKRDNPGYFLAPALFTETSNAMRINREEIFGPVASVVRVRDYEEALQVANDTAFGLSAGICTTSLKYAKHFKRNSEAGMVMINVPTAGVDYHVPFGGRKASSYGPREQGSYAVEFYSQVKTAYTG